MSIRAKETITELASCAGWALFCSARVSFVEVLLTSMLFIWFWRGVYFLVRYWWRWTSNSWKCSGIVAGGAGVTMYLLHLIQLVTLGQSEGSEVIQELLFYIASPAIISALLIQFVFRKHQRGQRRS